jgi:hypothetical protein
LQYFISNNFARAKIALPGDKEIRQMPLLRPILLLSLNILQFIAVKQPLSVAGKSNRPENGTLDRPGSHHFGLVGIQERADLFGGN